MLQTAANPVLASLIDIATNIHIHSNFSIHHPNYQSFGLPVKVADRFQQNSVVLQHKYLSLLLRNFVYGVYYNGSLQSILTSKREYDFFPPHQNLENNSMLGMDREFYEELHQNNHGKGYFDPDWLVLRLEPDGSMAVTKGGLTMHVEPDLIQHGAKSVKVNNLVGILMPKNRQQNGFYVAISNKGQDRQGNPDTNLGAGGIYFNINPGGAIALMDILTSQLNVAEISFSFQVLYNSSGYGRYDSGVLNFERSDYPEIHKILQTVYIEHQSYFQPEVPLFTKFLAPGLSLAEEPTQKFTAQESFGINRCQIIANALLEAWQKGNNSIEERINTIHKHFGEQLVDLQRPYLNPSSEDIYYPL
jgi:HopA1 effector protein family